MTRRSRAPVTSCGSGCRRCSSTSSITRCWRSRCAAARRASGSPACASSRARATFPAPARCCCGTSFACSTACPSCYLVGLVTVMFTEHHVRVGDLAAGTLLVMDHDSSREPRSQALRGTRSGLSPQAVDLIQELLDRWPALDEQNRATIARTLLARVEPQISADELARLVHRRPAQPPRSEAERQSMSGNPASENGSGLQAWATSRIAAWSDLGADPRRARAQARSHRYRHAAGDRAVPRTRPRSFHRPSHASCQPHDSRARAKLCASCTR